MRVLLTLIAAFVLDGAVAAAQDRVPNARPQFRFEDFPATATLTGRAAAPDFSTLPEVRPFAGNIQAGLGRGVNFAGAYTMVSWPCRSVCVSLLAVDRRSGHLYTAPDAFNGLQFRSDSRLLIVNPPEDIPLELRSNPPAEMRTEYWEFQEGTGFHRIDDPAIGALPGPNVIIFPTGWGSGAFGEALGTTEPPPPGRTPRRTSGQQQRAPAR
jgi:hypothetical protein